MKRAVRFILSACLILLTPAISAHAQLVVKNSQDVTVMSVSEQGNVGIGATSTDKLRVAGRTWTDAIRVGSSTTSGYVLTANQNGVGSWQQAPQYLKSVENVQNDNGNIDIVEGNGISVSANNTNKSITLAMSPSVVEIYALSQYVSPEYIIIGSNGDYRLSAVTTLQPGTYLSVFPGALQLAGGDPVQGTPPGNGGWIRLYESTSPTTYGKGFAAHHVGNLTNFETSAPSVNVFHLDQATDVAVRLFMDAYDDNASDLVYWITPETPLIYLIKLK